MAELFKIPLTEPKKRCPIHFCVSSDVITEARVNLPAGFVIHRFRGIIFKGAVVAPIVLFACQKWPALQYQDALAARCDSVEKRAAAGSSADNNYIVVVIHVALVVGSWRSLQTGGMSGKAAC